MSINPNSNVPPFIRDLEAQFFQKNTIDHIAELTNSPTLFPNEKPFEPFEYEGKKYASAWACFYAQQYTDQPNLMALFAQCHDLTQLKALAASHPMTPERKAAWENPHNTEGSKRVTLMCMKKELEASQAALAEAFTTLLTHDVGAVIIAQCGSTGMVELSCANKALFRCISKYVSQLPLKAIEGLCSHKLRILDIGFGIHFPNLIGLLAGCNRLIPLVEEDAGVSYFTLGEGYTRNQLMQTATDNGIKMEATWNDFLMETGAWEGPLELVGNTPIGKQSILISNNILCGSRLRYYEHQQNLVSQIGCALPSDLECIALCVYIKVITGEYLYPAYGGAKGTCGRIFTKEKPELAFLEAGGLHGSCGRTCTLNATGDPFMVGLFGAVGLNAIIGPERAPFVGAGAVRRFFFRDEPKDKQSG